MNILKAAAVAARLAQSIGNVVNEEIKLPEKIAGFINGRCGNDDELQNIQSATGCKIMLSRDSGKKKKKEKKKRLLRADEWIVM